MNDSRSSNSSGSGIGKACSTLTWSLNCLNTGSSPTGFYTAGANAIDTLDYSEIFGESTLTSGNIVTEGSLLDSGKETSSISSDSIGLTTYFFSIVCYS